MDPSAAATSTGPTRVSTRTRKPTIVNTNTAEQPKPAKRAPKKPRVNKRSYEYLVQNPDSLLIEADMKKILPEVFDLLPQEDKDELCALLPPCDRAYRDPMNNIIEPKNLEEAIRLGMNEQLTLTISPSFLKPARMAFWYAMEGWQEMLAAGNFMPIDPALCEEIKDEDLPWKDDEFELYWGERLERDKKLKRKSAKKAK
ncbi:Asx homology domain-containing protein [Radiomyces spectabilis]|uniref:Asx homology domain-containing protein n=1 Tax=Radiomyces spectabilis TaxID=64574 RepID=UPI00221F8A82|nr:Asx homology domain-containing protein [Radiomyces spectabilis]KAI8388887.1 Asx homology domain-containing protein [Radiomyces spectabilis]